MPVKRRAAKRRFSIAALAEAWEMQLTVGRDFFRELPSVGVAVDERGQPSEEDIAEAWRLLGPTILAERNPNEGPTWAERNLGKPWEAEERAGGNRGAD